jgi:ferrous iron transport protein B
MGKAIEPMIAPLGYDWKIGVGLIGAFAAREVFVATMGVVYSVGEDQDEESEGLHQAMQADLKPNGNPLWDLPTVFSILVFFVIAMQCISTVAVMRQETGSWKWPIIQLVGMNVLAYVLALLVYQIGVRL